MISTKGYWIYHVHNLELTVNKLKVKGLNCNIESFSQPKPKLNGLLFLSDFVIKSKTIPYAKNLLDVIKIEGFRYYVSLVLNMGYYHIQLS